MAIRRGRGEFIFRARRFAHPTGFWSGYDRGARQRCKVGSQGLANRGVRRCQLRTRQSAVKVVTGEKASDRGIGGACCADQGTTVASSARDDFFQRRVRCKHLFGALSPGRLQPRIRNGRLTRENQEGCRNRNHRSPPDVRIVASAARPGRRSTELNTARVAGQSYGGQIRLQRRGKAPCAPNLEGEIAPLQGVDRSQGLSSGRPENLCHTPGLVFEI